MSANVNYVIAAARLVEMVEAGQTTPDSVVWYLRLLLECYKRTRSTSYPPIEIRNRDLQALWNVDARAVSYRLSILHNNGLICHEQVGRYTWRIVLLIKQELQHAGGSDPNEPKLLSAGPVPDSSLRAEWADQRAPAPSRPISQTPGNILNPTRAVSTRATPAPQPRNPVPCLDSEPRNPVAILKSEPRNPVASLTIAENDPFRLQTREPRSPLVSLEPRNHTARLHINEEEEDNNSIKSADVSNVPVDKPVDNNVEVQAYLKRFAAKLSQKRMDRLSSYGVAVAVQLEQEIQAAIQLGRIQYSDINIGVIDYEYTRIFSMLSYRGRQRDAPALLVTNLRRMLHTGMIPQDTRPLPALPVN